MDGPRPRGGLAVGHGPVGRPTVPTVLRTFAVPDDQLPAARSWVAYGERRPRTLRRASIVAVVRDGPHGVETLLRHRDGPTPLGGIGLPGGSLESFDEEPCTWYGPTPAQWARVLGLDDHRLVRRHVVGAIRELFEETGILLAGRDRHSVAEDPGGGEWMEARQALDQQELTLSALVGRRGYGLRTDLLRAVGQWHSPDFAHRRYITQYFAAAVPHGQSTSLLSTATGHRAKGLWAEWMPASVLLEGQDSTRLGDLIARPGTEGRVLGRLTVPAVPLMLEGMARAGSTVRFLMGLTLRGAVPEFRVELLEGMEQVTSEDSAADGGKKQPAEPENGPEVPGDGARLTSPVTRAEAVAGDDRLRLAVRLPGGRWL